MSLPSDVDLRSELPAVRDQGFHRGTCLAFATTTAHEVRRRGAEERSDLSTETLFWAAKQVEGNRSDGTTFDAIIRAIADHGQPPESTWPYDPDRDITDPSYGPPQAAQELAALRRAELEPIDLNFDAVRVEVAAGNVVVIGIQLWDEFETLDKDDLDLPSPNELNGSYHAVAVVGYHQPHRRILLRNSWSEDWGAHGYAWLPCELIDHPFAVAAVVVRAVLPLPEAAEPREANAQQPSLGSLPYDRGPP